MMELFRSVQTTYDSTDEKPYWFQVKQCINDCLWEETRSFASQEEFAEALLQVTKRLVYPEVEDAGAGI